MGIPKFYSWIINNFPDVVYNIKDENKSNNNNNNNGHRIPIDNLYLDMNCIIHQFSYDSKQMLSILSFDDIIKNICNYIDFLIQLIQPKQLLFIAIDGVAPRAKLNQQRSRRYRSFIDRTEALNELKRTTPDSNFDNIELFDSNCITPGTEFMKEISIHLQKYINQQLESNLVWKQFRIYFSGSEVPGEGEHKIMNYLRSWRQSNSYIPDQRHCIYGNDADLIVLALATHEQYCYILRESFPIKPKKSKITSKNETVISSPKFHYLQINILRHGLKRLLLKDMSDDYCEDIDMERVYDDFIFLSYFIGNDFIPNIPTLAIKEGSLDSIFNAYHQTLLYSIGYIVHNGKICDFHRLNIILSHLNVEETKYMRSLTLSFQQLTTKEMKVIDPRTAYYYSKFQINTQDFEDRDKIVDISNEYICGLQWCLGYYSNGCLSWGWYFPYHYGPMLQDIIQYISLTCPQISFELGYPLLPFQQLLGCLPPGSVKLLPKDYHYLLVDSSSPIHHYYPTSSNIIMDMNGKKHSWEAIVILPFIKIEDLIVAESSYCSIETREDPRNQFGKLKLFYWEESSSNIKVQEDDNLHIEPSLAFISHFI